MGGAELWGLGGAGSRLVAARRLLLSLGAACALVLGSIATATAAAPTTARVDLSSTGVQAKTTSESPAVSANGRWVVFESAADNLVPGDQNGLSDVFLRDRRNVTTKRISVGAAGAEGDGSSSQASISGDGRWIAFSSSATNLVPGSTGGLGNVYLYDRTSGALQRVSNALGGGGGGNDNSSEPRLSSDGSVVVFTSGAANLVPGDGGKVDVFMYRIATGALTRVSARADGADPGGDARGAAASAGGAFVTFTSTANDLVSGDGGHSDVFVRDMTVNQITRVSVTSTGGEANSDSALSAISSDGCQIAFDSTASNLVFGDDNSKALKVFVRDRCAGSTEFASLSNGGVQGGVLDRRPVISDDGCLVGMVELANNLLVPAGGWRAAVLRDRCGGFTSRVDLSAAGEGGNGHTDGISFSAGTARYVVFHSGAENLVPGADANGAASDVFLRDRGSAVPPLADLQLVVEGRHVRADASGSSDPDNEIASVRIGFGDGSADTAGVAAVHEYARDGTFTVTAVVTDDDGLSATAARVVTVSGSDDGSGSGGGGPVRSPLTLKGAHLSRKRFAVARRGSQAATLSLTASDAAALTLRFERALPGRGSGRSCSPAARRGPRCTAYRAAGTATASLGAGQNSISLAGRTSSGKALAPGTYRLMLSATAADGRTATAANPLAFTILAKKGRRR
jgi:Tol biopolymer transport system component